MEFVQVLKTTSALSEQQIYEVIVFSKDANLLGRGAEQRRKERTRYCEFCPRVHHDVTGELKYSNICKLMKKHCQLPEFETPR